MADLTTATPLDIGLLITQLGGGLALFLFGMRQMTESLKTVAGGGMKRLLARLTTNRFTAAFAGAIITAVIQSSSITTVLVVGFISAGLLNLSQSIGVILGANIGTTVTAQIIAFNVYKYGLVMIAIGFFTDILARREYLRQWGVALMGLGLLFFGMELMSIGTAPLRQWPPFIDLMQNMDNPLLAIAIGAVFTAAVQSSSATTGIVIVLASQGLISLESGIGLIFGSNIGTCVTAFIAAVGRPREALQAAWVHILFNVGGVLLWVLFIPQFADAVRSISPISQGLVSQGFGDATAATANTARQVANAHTLFNVANLLVFIWFTGPLSKLVNRIVPERPKPKGIEPEFLDEMYLEQPALALDQVRRELVRMAKMVRSMLRRSLHIAAAGTEQELTGLKLTNDAIDTLYQETIHYLGALSQQDLIRQQPEQLSQFIGVANYLENMGDTIEKDLLAIARKRISKGVTVSPSTMVKLHAMEKQACDAFENVLLELETGDQSAALEAIESKAAIKDLAEDANAHLAYRLTTNEPDRLEAFHVETDIIDIFRRLNTSTRRIAKLRLEMNRNDRTLGD